MTAACHAPSLRSALRLLPRRMSRPRMSFDDLYTGSAPKALKCDMCKGDVVGEGHNPSPLEGSCVCDECNAKVVMPARAKSLKERIMFSKPDVDPRWATVKAAQEPEENENKFKPATEPEPKPTTEPEPVPKPTTESEPEPKPTTVPEPEPKPTTKMIIKSPARARRHARSAKKTKEVIIKIQMIDDDDDKVVMERLARFLVPEHVKIPCFKDTDTASSWSFLTKHGEFKGWVDK